MDFSRAGRGERRVEIGIMRCNSLPNSNLCLCKKKAFCLFSAIFAPLRELVFPCFGPKDEEKTRENGPRQWVFIYFVYQFPRTDPLGLSRPPRPFTVARSMKGAFVESGRGVSPLAFGHQRRDAAATLLSAPATGCVAFDSWSINRYLWAMPIYEFHCGKCGADSEVLVRSSRKNDASCPKCGSKRLTKKLSLFASSGGENSSEAAACTGQPSSCGLCGTGRPHSH